jgi:hypothetical protein
MSAIWKVVVFPEEREQEVIDMREFVITVNSTVDEGMAGRETCSGSSVEIYN